MLARAVAIALSASLLACGGGKKKVEKGPPEIDGLAALGAGIRVVVGGDIELLEASRLVRRGVAAMLARDVDLKSRVDGIVSDCQLEPGKNVQSFMIGLGEAPDEALLVVTGEFEENALTACVQKRLGELGGRLETKAIAGRTAYRAESGKGSQPVWFALGSPRTLIVSSSEGWLANGLGEGPRLTDDAASKALLGTAATDHALWAVGFVTAEVAKMVVDATGGQIGAPVSMAAKAQFKEGIQAELDAELASEKDAKLLQTLQEMQKDVALASLGLGRLGEKMVATADGKHLKIRFTATEAELSDLLASVDSGVPSQQNPPSPEPEGPGPQGEEKDVEGNTTADDEAPLR